MLQLVHAFGGTRTFLPATVGPESPLATAVGVKAAEAIVRELGAGHVTIPLGADATYERIRRAIRDLVAKGLSNRTIARRLGCHERTVERERRKLREAVEPPLLSIMGRR